MSERPCEPLWKQSLLKASWFPLLLQAVCFAAFIGLIAGGWGVDSKDSGFLKELRNTNLANLIVWSFWWPLLIVVMVVFGRFWCMVCPIEPLTSWSARLGLRRPVPKWMQSGWAATGLYLVILFVGIHCLAIHRSPHRMSIFLIALLGLGVGVGLLFEKRAFCAHVCPIVPMLKLYSKLAAVEWKAIDRSVCDGCKTKDCIASKNLYHWQGRSCGNSVYLANTEQNGDCILCTQCAKVCPYDNVTLKWRSPFRDLGNPAILRLAEAWFILVVSGFVIYEILTEWAVTKRLLLWLPDWIKAQTGIAGAWYSGLVHATLIFLLLPLALWLAAWLVDRSAGWKRNFSSYVAAFSMAVVPVAAAGHLCKSTLKAGSRLAYLPYVPGDPIGFDTAGAIVGGTLTLKHPAIVAAGWPVTVLLVVFLLAGLWVAIVALRGIGRREGRFPLGAAVAVVAYWSIFAVTIAAWRVF